MKVNPHKMSNAARKAMDSEINRQIAEKDAQYAADLDATILLVLRITKGWGKKRLRAFWEDFNKVHHSLREFYQMNEAGDIEWLAHRKLKEIGVDVHQWYKEVQSNED